MENHRIKQIDGLRGLAVLYVISFHYINNSMGFSDISNVNFVNKVISKITYFGWCGVDLFFVLSGFLIGTILLKNNESKTFFKTFYLRRFFRIVPIYYLLLILFFLIKQTNVYSTDIYIFNKDISLHYYFLFLQNFVMSYRDHFGPEAITPTWSLAVEEQFYLIIPLIIYFINPKHYLKLIAFFILIAICSRFYFTNFYQKYTLLSSRIDSPIMGFLLAYILSIPKSKLYIENNQKHITKVSIIILFFGGLLYLLVDVGPFNHTIIAIFFSLILLLTLYLKKGFLYKILTSKSLLFIGSISYFIYLFHQLINGLLHLLILNQKKPMLGDTKDILVTLAAFILTIFFGFLSFKLIEKPLINFSHKFKY